VFTILLWPKHYPKHSALDTLLCRKIKKILYMHRSTAGGSFVTINLCLQYWTINFFFGGGGEICTHSLKYTLLFLFTELHRRSWNCWFHDAARISFGWCTFVTDSLCSVLLWSLNVCYLLESKFVHLCVSTYAVKVMSQLFINNFIMCVSSLLQWHR
jgi:hypothetical protein